MTVGEAASSSSDGRGAESTPGQPETKLANRYIYYRLYTKEGALESNNPIYSNDRFISRVVAKNVTPPHTGASIKRHLFRIEGFEGLGNGSLYASLVAPTHLEGSARVSLRGNSGPGLKETEPMALIVDTSALEERLAASTVDPKTLPERRGEQRYVYYCIYDEGGRVSSKNSFNENDSSLGRIEALSIPPPHAVSSLRSRLVTVEEISNQDIQLFKDEYGESIMNDDDAIALSSSDYPGTTEDEPIVMVYESQKGSSASKLQDSEPPLEQAFSKLIKAKPGYERTTGPDLAWHFFTAGDIFKTDGILRREKYNYNGTILEPPCYVAINSAGKKAFMWESNVDFLDI